MKKIYSGFVCPDAYGFLCLEEGDPQYQSDNALALRLSDDIPVGTQVFARFYIADKKITEDEAVTALVVKTFGGVLQASYVLEAYSEVTIEAWDENATIGGHNIIDMIATFAGKYCLLIIDTDPLGPDPTITPML